MKIFKITALLILSLGIFSNAADAQTKKKKPVRKSKTAAVKPVIIPAPKPPEAIMPNYKILVEGSQSKVETPFVFVARDAETYALIRALVEGLPESSTVDFSKSAVVAGFAGTKNTGGWSVKIRQAADKVSIDVSGPPKGGMSTQVITYPFQVVSIPLTADQPLNVEIPAAWISEIRNYRVSKGEFEYTGGIAGISKKFNAEGTIGVLTSGEHSTYIFNLAGKGKDHNRKLLETVSGIRKGGTFEIARLDAGSFVEVPRPPLKVLGTMIGKKLTFNFESLPPNVADGYLGKGKIEAVEK